jgi:transcription antitermination factor NusG
MDGCLANTTITENTPIALAMLPRRGVNEYFVLNPWYAIRTRSNHEKIAATALRGKGYDPFLPLYCTRRARTDRTVEIELPIFAGYLFCRFDAKRRLPILTTNGVVSILGFGNEPAAIPDHEIEAVGAVLRAGLSAEPHPYWREGQRVRVSHGSLEGVEGVLLKQKNELRIVISVTMLQRSISVEIDHDHLIPV